MHVDGVLAMRAPASYVVVCWLCEHRFYANQACVRSVVRVGKMQRSSARATKRNWLFERGGWVFAGIVLVGIRWNSVGGYSLESFHAFYCCVATIFTNM